MKYFKKVSQWLKSSGHATFFASVFVILATVIFSPILFILLNLLFWLGLVKVLAMLIFDGFAILIFS